MPERSSESYEEELRDSRLWRSDVARELRALEKRVDDVAELVTRNSRQIGSLTRKADIAKAVADRLEERGKRRLEWWHIVLAVVALAPAYVTMIVLLSRLG